MTRRTKPGSGPPLLFNKCLLKIWVFKNILRYVMSGRNSPLVRLVVGIVLLSVFGTTVAAVQWYTDAPPPEVSFLSTEERECNFGCWHTHHECSAACDTKYEWKSIQNKICRSECDEAIFACRDAC